MDKKYTLEVGGKTKTKAQQTDIGNSFVVKDDIEAGAWGVVPMWLFGLMY